MPETTGDGVSVITIVLNGEDFIQDTLRSVLGQRGVPLEYIVIDGGSTDRTLEKIALYRDAITHLVTGPDGGIYQAINKGLALCTKPLVGIIHCGDSYTAGAVSKAYRAFKSTGAEIIYGDIRLRDDDLGEELSAPLRADHRMLRGHMSVFHPSVFVARASYQKLGFYDPTYRLAADYDWLLSAALANRSFYHIPEVLAIFRSGGPSSTHTATSLRENYRIRRRRLGRWRAVSFAARRFLTVEYFKLRKRIGEALIGQQRYRELKRARHLAGPQGHGDTAK